MTELCFIKVIRNPDSATELVVLHGGLRTNNVPVSYVASKEKFDFFQL
jgi:hypothetical protein